MFQSFIFITRKRTLIHLKTKPFLRNSATGWILFITCISLILGKIGSQGVCGAFQVKKFLGRCMFDPLCECFRAPSLFSDLFTRDPTIPHRSTCCCCWDNRWYGNRHPPDAAVRRPTRFPNVRRIDVTAGRCVTSRRNMRADILLSVAERRPETYFYFRLENDYDFSRSSY